MKRYTAYNIKISKNENETQYHFNEWINGNFEDDPLPLEINTMIFIFSLNNNMISLSLSGGENLCSLNQPLMYYPLELQFFNYEPFYNLLNKHIYFVNKRNRFDRQNKINFICLVIKDLVNEYLLKNKKSPLNRTNIYVGELYKYAKICIKTNLKKE